MKKEKHIIIYPMLPRNFSRKKRAEIRRKEKEILSSSKVRFSEPIKDAICEVKAVAE